MIGMILITHGALGEALRDIVTHVVGPQCQFQAIGVDCLDDIVATRAKLQTAIAETDDGEGVLLLTDIFGSTPSNLALSLRREGQVEVLAGVNVPMLVKLAKTRSNHTLAECAELATSAGRKYIAAASQLPPSCLQGGKSCEMVMKATLSFVPHVPSSSLPVMALPRAPS
ncbi:PTS sugar transporter subunit IIA [Kozakia baliensis]|uniref:PTS sugar transporter subunit IIA n=1 Tax=Kozakia baliensis TaxID=153496 RepID=UPI00089DB8E7|nr:hypothetical protein [Kozakia baliensis]GBR26452.1 PTS system transporter subunit IIA [Kozakia baliensis NRIC 0488]GEL64356.1 PTS fructose transporter subunit IIA [Kozakia baliensis]